MRLKTLLFSIILVLICSVFTFAQISNMKVISKVQDPSPQGGNIATLNQPSINNKGEAAFLASDNSPRIYISKNTFVNPQLESIVERGTPVVGTNGLSIFRAIFPKINDNRDVLFGGSVSNDTSVGGLFLYSEGQVTVVALNGFQTPIGGIFSGLTITNLFSLNNSKDIVFSSQIDGGTSKFGIFLAKNGKITKVVAEGDPAPDGSSFKISSTPVASINNKGDILFSALTDANPKPAVYVVSDGQLRRVVGAGDIAPEGGIFEQAFAMGKYINDNREVLFTGKVAGKDSIYLISLETNKITRLIADGDPSPDGAVFRLLGISLTPSHGILLNNGHFAFRASTVNTIYGLFYYINGKTFKIVGQREATPLGGVFPDTAAFNCAFLGPIASENDQVVFEAIISGGTSPKAIIGWTPQPITSPTITSANYDNKTKSLSIKASTITSDVKVEINDKLTSQPIKVVSGTELSLTGNRKKLNLNKAPNSNKVVLIFGGLRTQPFTF